MNDRDPKDAPSPRPPLALRRSLGRSDFVVIGLNATVGSGIFLLPDDLYRAMGPWSPLSFLLCGALLLPIAWCYADASRHTDTTGGPYVYARRAHGESVGFIVGWMCFVNAIFSYAAVAEAAAAYAQRLASEVTTELWTKVLACLLITVFGALNYWGAKPGAMAIRLLTAGKFAVLLLLISVLLPELRLARTFHHTAPSGDGILRATFLSLFALQGFEVVPVAAGEAKSPESAIPRAILWTVSSTAVFYLLIQLVLVLGFDGLKLASDAPLADAALSLSPSLGVVVAVGALVSTLGFVSGSALGTPRYLFAIASHRGLPSLLAHLHPVHLSPHVAILGTTALAVLLVIPLDYRTLIGMSNVAVAVQYGSTCAASFRSVSTGGEGQRRKRKLIALWGMSVSLAICTVASRRELMFAGGALLVGLPLHTLSRRFDRLFDGNGHES